MKATDLVMMLIADFFKNYRHYFKNDSKKATTYLLSKYDT